MNQQEKTALIDAIVEGIHRKKFPTYSYLPEIIDYIKNFGQEDRKEYNSTKKCTCHKFKYEVDMCPHIDVSGNQIKCNCCPFCRINCSEVS